MGEPTFATLGCFGKLPIHADFIGYRAAAPEVQALDQWFQEGILAARSRLGRGWESDFLKSPPWRFVFYTAGTASFLTGVAIPSRDQSGRCYPFFLFLKVERKRFSLPLWFAPVVYAGFLGEATSFAWSAWQGAQEGVRERMTARVFLDRLERTPFTVPGEGEIAAVEEAYRRMLETKRVRDFLEALFGTFEDRRKYLLDRRLGEIVEMRGSRFPAGWGVRFPLFPCDSGPGYDVPFWVDLVGRWTAPITADPVLFWSRSNGLENGSAAGGALLAFFGPPSPKGFLSLIRPDLENDACYDLVPRTSDPGSGVATGRRPLLEEGELSLAAWLNRIGS